MDSPSESPRSKIPGIPYRGRRKSPKQTRVTTSPEWIERGPLAPWMLRYAQWLLQQPEAELAIPNKGSRKRMGPTVTERVAKASLEAKRVIRARSITSLEQRPDFREYFDKCRGDVAFLLRETMKLSAHRAVEARDKALERASGRQEMPDGTVMYGEMDIRAVNDLTRWVPEVAFPKKEQGAEKAPTIILHLGGQSAAKLLGVANEPEIPDVEYEVIENQKLLTDGEDDNG
jgi:hypothetical protein